MRGWLRIVLTSTLASVIAATVFIFFLGGLSDHALLASIGLGLIVVGIPALLGIVCVQRPAKRWAERRGYASPAVWGIVIGANILLTLLAGIAVMRQDLLGAPLGLGMLAACAIVAAAMWLTIEWKFGEVDG
ncbi:MAG: hypothetical protein ABW173_07945 [Sphingomonas sp.]